MDAWLDELRITTVGRHQTKARMPSAGYHNRVLAEVRAFCRWLVAQERLGRDPSRLLERRVVERGIKAQLSVSEGVALCALPSPDPVRQRWILLMLLAGLRSDEAVAITWGDIVGGHLYVRRHVGHRLKRGKERLVPAVPLLASLLGPRGDDDERIAPLPGANTTHQRGRDFAGYLHAIGIDPAMATGKRTPHSARHTYGAMLTATGVPTALLRQWMGHAGIATTSDYAAAAPQRRCTCRPWRGGRWASCAWDTSAAQAQPNSQRKQSE